MNMKDMNVSKHMNEKLVANVFETISNDYVTGVS